MTNAVLEVACVILPILQLLSSLSTLESILPFTFILIRCHLVEIVAEAMELSPNESACVLMLIGIPHALTIKLVIDPVPFIDLSISSLHPALSFHLVKGPLSVVSLFILELAFTQAMSHAFAIVSVLDVASIGRSIGHLLLDDVTYASAFL